MKDPRNSKDGSTHMLRTISLIFNIIAIAANRLGFHYRGKFDKHYNNYFFKGNVMPEIFQLILLILSPIPYWDTYI